MDWWWVVATLNGAVQADGDPWAAELARLDVVRAQAFARGDSAALSEVYVDEAAAADDAATIRSYADRGGRLIGVVLDVSSVEVREKTARRVELAVTDQLRRPRVVWNDGTVDRLPRDQPTNRVVVLERTNSGWKISESRRR